MLDFCKKQSCYSDCQIISTLNQTEASTGICHPLVLDL
ncbi:hypothetical protein Rifp1Sym_bb00040 [endosymbiont of Riftia pachyptila (vent Ph05)]|uniref:Uncharacterized protein n=2 Tax=sulfur-oxidizing symbionts TaxID=32036 RepID=G2FBY6_9GAMM|nr:hypothetical protein Rifp1Sym_bb00040 [endosymbiont of Riftia pachyptila (vent Ph05)]EGW55817.1 hypothetical protein TevJSym_ab01700 [endosymbiont of Tevnia jerichonana (vent Tica)]